MPTERVTITRRHEGLRPGFTEVFAYVTDGDSGIYMIANAIIGTDAEIREILEQSAQRMEAREATRAGRD